MKKEEEKAMGNLITEDPSSRALKADPQL